MGSMDRAGHLCIVDRNLARREASILVIIIDYTLVRTPLLIILGTRRDFFTITVTPTHTTNKKECIVSDTDLYLDIATPSISVLAYLRSSFSPSLPICRTVHFPRNCFLIQNAVDKTGDG